ncbi:hypothetical protein Stsp01_13570 [Streptomyces sp. NBRC 13847]|nr:hypothetical protein Stsp01_13570 [Streptomyces sp. NBRC 13847]
MQGAPQAFQRITFGAPGHAQGEGATRHEAHVVHVDLAPGCHTRRPCDAAGEVRLQMGHTVPQRAARRGPAARIAGGRQVVRVIAVCRGGEELVDVRSADSPERPVRSCELVE